jgi:hypothetical protein
MSYKADRSTLPHRHGRMPPRPPCTAKTKPVRVGARNSASVMKQGSRGVALGTAPCSQSCRMAADLETCKGVEVQQVCERESLVVTKCSTVLEFTTATWRPCQYVRHPSRPVGLWRCMKKQTHVVAPLIHQQWPWPCEWFTYEYIYSNKKCVCYEFLCRSSGRPLMSQ